MGARQQWRYKTRSDYTAARLLGMYKSKPHSKMVALALESARHYREVVLSKVGRLVPRWTKEIHALAVAEWGDASERRTWNALKRLVRDGAVRRTEDGYLLVTARKE